MPNASTHDLLVSLGYELVEDASKEHGRRTYVHEDDASRGYVQALQKRLHGGGWKMDRDKLRSFQHPRTGEIIELEPGGADTAGHLLHHITR